MKPNLPKEPPEKLLKSMAIRYDHGLAIPGYYDQEMTKGVSKISHEDKLKATMNVMSQLYEEVAGYGFYKYEEEIPEYIYLPKKQMYSFDRKSS